MKRPWGTPGASIAFVYRHLCSHSGAPEARGLLGEALGKTDRGSAPAQATIGEAADIDPAPVRAKHLDHHY